MTFDANSGLESFWKVSKVIVKNDVCHMLTKTFLLKSRGAAERAPWLKAYISGLERWLNGEEHLLLLERI